MRYGLAGTAGTNLVINSTLAWASSIDRTRVPAWTAPLVGGPSIIGNTLAMLVALPLTTSVICTTCIRFYQRRGLRVLNSAELPGPVRHLIVGPIRRGLRLAGASSAAFGPLTVLVGLVGAGHGVSHAGFIVSQSLTGVLLGALITPLVAMAAMAEPTHIRHSMNGTASLEIRALPEAVYDLVADVSRMGEWSPECHRCEWLDGATAASVGVRFRGHNKSGPFRWSNTSQVTEAERGKILSWTMGPGDNPYSAWQYTFKPTPGGVIVTETFRSLRHTRLGRLSMLPMGGQRRSQARLQRGIQQTLDRLRARAEAIPEKP